MSIDLTDEEMYELNTRLTAFQREYAKVLGFLNLARIEGRELQDMLDHAAEIITKFKDGLLDAGELPTQDTVFSWLQWYEKVRGDK